MPTNTNCFVHIRKSGKKYRKALLCAQMSQTCGMRARTGSAQKASLKRFSSHEPIHTKIWQVRKIWQTRSHGNHSIMPTGKPRGNLRHLLPATACSKIWQIVVCTNMAKHFKYVLCVVLQPSSGIGVLSGGAVCGFMNASFLG